jgi:hypothetical protein
MVDEEAEELPRPPDPRPDEDPELEAIIRPLIVRKRALPEGSAEYRFVERQLEGLSHTRYLAQEYIHDIESELISCYSSHC